MVAFQGTCDAALNCIYQFHRFDGKKEARESNKQDVECRGSKLLIFITVVP